MASDKGERMRRKIWVTFKRKGYHKYPAAGTNPKLADVSYLANEHRHLFGFKVSIEVKHDDREIEFHQFLNWIEGLYDEGILQLDYKSCEMMAEDLFRSIVAVYPGRAIEIEVNEDGECGAVCSWDANELVIMHN